MTRLIRSDIRETAQPNDTRPGEQRAAKSPAYHPYLIGIFPVLALYAANFAETPFADVALPLILAIGLAAIISLLFRATFKTKEQAAIASSYLLTLIFAYSYMHLIISAPEDFHEFYLADHLRFRFFLLGSCLAVVALVAGLRQIGFKYWRPVAWFGALYMLAVVVEYFGHFFAIWCVAVGAGLLWIYKGTFNYQAVNRFLNLFAVILLIGLLLQFGMELSSAPFVAAPTAHAATPPTDEDQEIALRSPAQPRNIYYLVLDRYGSNRTLRDEYGYDNTPFYEQLRQRGFRCATDSHTNYPKSVLAMSAAFNMRYHHEIISTQAHYTRQTRSHRVGRLLKSQGYTFYHLGVIYNPLRYNHDADFNYRFSSMPSEFADILYRFTPLRDFLRTSDREIVLGKFKLLEDLASEEGPIFCYAHFNLPHPPFVFDQDGSGVSRAVLASRPYHENYLNQLKFTNGRIIQLIDTILARSKVTPVIVIQADEGPYLSAVDEEKNELERLRKRTGIVSAFLLPNVDAPEKIPSTISPVNTFRIVFKEYFGADIELLDDRTFYWENPTQDGGLEFRHGGRFIDVTAELHGRT